MPVWAFKVWIWERPPEYLLRFNECSMLRCVRQNKVSMHPKALDFQKDGWSCGYQSLHTRDEVIAHRGSLGYIDIILSPSPPTFIRNGMRIINVDPSVLDVICWKGG